MDSSTERCEVVVTGIEIGGHWFLRILEREQEVDGDGWGVGICARE